MDLGFGTVGEACYLGAQEFMATYSSQHEGKILMPQLYSHIMCVRESQQTHARNLHAHCLHIQPSGAQLFNI